MPWEMLWYIQVFHKGWQVEHKQFMGNTLPSQLTAGGQGDLQSVAETTSDAYV